MLERRGARAHMSIVIKTHGLFFLGQQTMEDIMTMSLFVVAQCDVRGMGICFSRSTSLPRSEMANIVDVCVDAKFLFDFVRLGVRWDLNPMSHETRWRAGKV